MPLKSSLKRPYVAELKRIARLGERARAVIGRHHGDGLAGQVRLLERLADTAAALEKGSASLPEAMVLEIGRAVRPKVTRAIVASTGYRREALIAESLARGQTHRAQLLADPRLMLSSDALAGRLGVTRMTINNWREERKLLALRNAANDYRYPAWQAEDTIRAVIPALREALRGLDAWDAYRFFTIVDGYLGRTPLDALRAGDTGKVLRAARGYAER